jgi:DNA-binding MurR/RpiR family transcriptional regulator
MTRTKSPKTIPAAAQQQPSSIGLRAHLVGELPQLPPAQRRLAEYLLANMATASDLGITDLAEEAGVSVGTVSQLCRRLDLRGYQDLRLGWARAAVSASSAGAAAILAIDPSMAASQDPIEHALLRVFGGNADALVETVRSLDRRALEQAVSLLAGARRVEWLGSATAGLVAAEGALKLRKLGVDAVAQPDGHQQAMSAALLTPADVVVAVSHSGRTVEVLRGMQLARDAGAQVIAITGAGPSPLRNWADVVLATVSDDTAFQIEPMASTIVELSVVQLLFLLLLERGGAAAQAALARTQAAVEPLHTTGRIR